MNPIEQNLRATGKPYLILGDLIRAGLAHSLDVEPQTIYLRVSKLRGADTPEAFGGFRAGAVITFTADAGIEYAKHLEKMWAKKEPA